MTVAGGTALHTTDTPGVNRRRRYTPPLINPFSTTATRTSFSRVIAATRPSLIAGAYVGGSLMVCEA
jgi:hypothetical protein